MQGEEGVMGSQAGEKETLIKYWTDENLLQQQKGYFDYATRKMFDRYLSGLDKKKVLDVGCGMGMSMDYFRDHGAVVTGIDITAESVKYVNKNGLSAVVADARSLPYKDNSFDMVYSIGVIEHFKETQTALEEQARVCRPGGMVIAVVPNLATPYSAATILFEYLSGRAKYGILTTYGKPFSRKKFKGMFEAAGCRDISVRPYYGSAFLRFLFNRVYERITDAIESSFLSRFGLVLWGMGQKK
jgi:ubiquinone/menaquinone biosynthesis C-methylase UbiE